MEEMKVFQNSEFGELGILMLDGKEYFPATQCAKVLGYVNPQKAVRDHCKGDGCTIRSGVSVTTNQHGKATQQTVSIKYITEGNLYRPIVGSKLPAAERFERWVFDEVLPSIRKSGGYGSGTEEKLLQISESVLKSVQLMAQAAKAITVLADKLNQQTATASAQAFTTIVDLPADAYNQSKCKPETFPEPLISRVNDMMEEMIRDQALNFSSIARFCTLNGYTISSPAVKKYFDRNFAQS